MRRAAFFIWLAVLIPSQALGFCSEPSFYGTEPSVNASAPDAPSSFTRPDVPWCLSSYSYSGEHTCERWELDSYFADVENYIDELNQYIEDARSFADDVRSYAEEAIEYANSAQRFAAEAYDYALCDAEEVNTQHQ